MHSLITNAMPAGVQYVCSIRQVKTQMNYCGRSKSASVKFSKTLVYGQQLNTDTSLFITGSFVAVPTEN